MAQCPIRHIEKILKHWTLNTYSIRKNHLRNNRFRLQILQTNGEERRKKTFLIEMTISCLGVRSARLNRHHIYNSLMYQIKNQIILFHTFDLKWNKWNRTFLNIRMRWSVWRISDVIQCTLRCCFFLFCLTFSFFLFLSSISSSVYSVQRYFCVHFRYIPVSQ